MKTFILSLALIIGLSHAQEGFTLTDEQTLTIKLGLCPTVDYMTCLEPGIAKDRALKPCTSNSDCYIDVGSFCCPSKCAGMRCSRENTEHFIEEYCPKYEPQHILRNCPKLDESCHIDCRCCVDAGSCSRKCLD
ncbi:uncharacterized protein LOC100907598 [Galendromus occidentalis]|uniref:Uncharacterized protein LOC100907598 n=1 Tax=Galendromus occidentalis TaxID=34638 RepID=A0AAJ6VWT1_9ACAR|nr:uncharacterized protein LOC100907598 [Galendromus occidentalis]